MGEIQQTIRRRDKALLVAITVGCLLWAGCGSLIPKKKTESSAAKAVEKIASEQSLAVQKVVEGERTPVISTPPINVSGTSNSIAVTIEQPQAATNSPIRETVSIQSSSGQDVSTSEAFRSETKITIPMWVNLVGFSIGLILLLFAIKLWRNSSASFRTLYDTGDSGMASLIDHLTAMAKSSTDAGEMARLNAAISLAEKTRGKFNSI